MHTVSDWHELETYFTYLDPTLLKNITFIIEFIDLAIYSYPALAPYTCLNLHHVFAAIFRNYDIRHVVTSVNCACQ